MLNWDLLELEYMSIEGITGFEPTSELVVRSTTNLVATREDLVPNGGRNRSYHYFLSCASRKEMRGDKFTGKLSCYCLFFNETVDCIPFNTRWGINRFVNFNEQFYTLVGSVIQKSDWFHTRTPGAYGS